MTRRWRSVFITAEIGVNHGGDIGVAMDLIDRAHLAGVDAVKFQLWQKATFPELEQFRLRLADIEHLAHYAKKKGIHWYCTAFDAESVDFLASLGMRYWKIPNNRKVKGSKNLVRKISEQEADRFFISGNPRKWTGRWIWPMFSASITTAMHCVSLYPTPPEKSGLGSVQYWWGGWGGGQGISDHSGLPEIPVAAVALGAEAVECHITLDKNAEGPDHRASLTPVEFALMVRMVRNVEKAIA